MEEITQLTVEKFGDNPYWDTWQRGRPTKEAKRRRFLYHEWNKKHIELYPELYPSLTILLNSSSQIGSVVSDSGTSGVKIRYVQRGIAHDEQAKEF